MAFCSQCNASIAEDAKFCPACGAKTANAVQVPAHTPRKLHCPQCKSHNIAITTETSVNGAVTSNVGSMAATSVSNTHRNYWVCCDCGTKFRNIQNLEEEIKKSKNDPLIFTVFTIIGLIASIFFIIRFSDMKNVVSEFILDPIFYPLIFGSILFTIVFFCMIFVYKKRLKKMRAELAYLKANCFN